MFQVWVVVLPSPSVKKNDLGLPTAFAVYDPFHLGWSFPALAAMGFLLRTRSPSHMSFLTTWLSLHLLVWSWYLVMFSTASSLMPSIVSLEYSSSCAKTCFIMRRLWCLISLGSIASSLYRSLSGVKPIVLDVVVLWDHTTFGSSSTHLPLRRLNRVFWDCWEYYSVSSLYCSIWLWMIDWCKGYFCAYTPVEFFKFVWVELLPIINC